MCVLHLEEGHRRVVDLVRHAHGFGVDDWRVELLPRAAERLGVQDVGGILGAGHGLARPVAALAGHAVLAVLT